TLKDGYQVIYSESTRNMTLPRLEKHLKQINNQIQSSNFVSIIGGPQATGNPAEILKMGADIVVVGEGEVTYPQLISNLFESQMDYSLFHDFPGIAFIDKTGSIIITEERPKIDLNQFCPYSSDSRFAIHPPIELMRGCAFRCRFCQVPYMYGNPRFRSIQMIQKIVEHYIDHFSPLKESVDIRFIAPNSLGYMEKKRGVPNFPVLKELVDQVTSNEVRLFFGTFPSEVRPEYLNEETLSLFEKTTNEYISVGFQSGSDRILSEMRRGHTVADGLRAFDLITSQHYIPIFDFILGSPSETIQDQWETLDLIRQFRGKAKVRLHYLMPLPGTPWSEVTPVPLGQEILAEIGRLAKSEIIMGEFNKQMNFNNVKSN
ncbi:TIGR04013 family B12-binding domain/radical SAM domain-containing protein, partial [Candidatus Hodarchaeum mangrovi]